MKHIGTWCSLIAFMWSGILYGSNTIASSTHSHFTKAGQEFEQIRNDSKQAESVLKERGDSAITDSESIYKNMTATSTFVITR